MILQGRCGPLGDLHMWIWATIPGSRGAYFAA